MNAQQTIIAAATQLVANDLVKQAENVIKLAADKDKSKEKTQFNETTKNVETPLQQQPVDNAQGELSPSDVSSADQSQAPLPPPVANPATVGDGTAPITADVAPDQAAAGEPVAYDEATGEPVVAPEQGPSLTSTAAQVAREFLGQDVYNAASQGNVQAMDLMARTAAQLGVGVYEAQSRALPTTQNFMPEDPSTMAPTQGLDPASMAAMGMQAPQPDQTAIQSGQAGAPMISPVQQDDPVQVVADQILPAQPPQVTEQGSQPAKSPDKAQDKKKAEEPSSMPRG